MSIFNFWKHLRKPMHEECERTKNTSSDEIPTKDVVSFNPTSSDIEVLMRLKQFDPAKPLQDGIINVFCNDIPSLAKKFIEFGYMEEPSLKDKLKKLTVAELKEILKCHSLTVTGKKADLIDRIISNIPISNLKLENNKKIYFVSQKGQALIEDYKRQRDETEMLLNNSCISLILKSNFTEAYQKIGSYYAKSPVPHGIGLDWIEESLRVFQKSECKIFSDCLNFFDSETDTYFDNDKNTFNACVILCHFKGENYQKALKHYSEYTARTIDKETIFHISLRAHYLSVIISSLNDLNSYLIDGINKFDVLCCDDSCEICKTAARKSHSCKTAKIGKTLPPFHKGCRCTTVAHF